MTEVLLSVPVVAPLLGAGLQVVVRVRVQAAIGLAVTAAVLAVSGVLVSSTLDGSVLTQRLGDWPQGIAITFAADTFSAVMLGVTALVVIACLAFAVASGEDWNPGFGPLVMIMSAGTYGAFLTADLFTFFVLVELMLVPSYALLTMAGGGHRVRAGRLYVAVNLLASTTLLAGIGLVYGTAGTVNLAALAGAGTASVHVAVGAGVVLTALAVKAAAVPVHGWLPATYPHASPVVTALFSGLLTKVGVYGIMRIYAVVFEGSAGFHWLIMVVAAATMVVGVLAAVGEQAVRPILAFHMVSQIGYIILGLSLFTDLGLAAAVFFMVQYIPVKACLFLVAGAIEVTFGTDRIDRLGGITSREPILAVTFAVAAMALVGIPPLSGFVGKFVLVRAAAADGEYLGGALVVAVSLVTLISMVKVWNTVFWGREHEPVEWAARAAVTTRVRPGLVVPPLALAVVSVAAGLGAHPLLAVAEAAGGGLLDVSAYVTAVLGS